MKKLLIILALFAMNMKTLAQETGNAENKPTIEFNLQLKNMHFWRGYAVTTAPMLGSMLYYQSPNEQWKMGFWGGMGFAGTYREFDTFISYQKGGFSAALWDIYNFSTPDISGRGFFDYSNRTTGHFLDLTLAYDFGEQFPFKLSASTILLGRDSEFIGAEPTTFFERTGNLRYTTYFEGRYTLINAPAYQLQAFVGAAVALSGAGDNFYANRSGINFVGLTYNRIIQIGNFKIPVQATPAWNPNAEHAYMEIAVSFF